MRAIDGDELIEKMYPFVSFGSVDYSELKRVVKSMPTIKPSPHWIPVTKRLPEPRIDVWCNSDLGQMVGYYDETIETWFGRDYLELLVNAWMPLPEPYREGEENV